LGARASKDLDPHLRLLWRLLLITAMATSEGTFDGEEEDDDDSDLDPPIDPDWLAALYKAARTDWFGKIVYERGIYLECGRRQSMCFKPSTAPATTRVTVDQITIREIKLSPKFQRRGGLTGLVRYFFRELGVAAVQLEQVLNTSLRERLLASPLWVCQTAPEELVHGGSFVRFKTASSAEEEDGEIFTLL